MYRYILLAVVVAGVVVNTGLYMMVTRGFRLSPPLISLSGYVARGETALCPGDVLDYTLTVEPRIPGVFDVDVAVWRVSPPATVIFSSLRRSIITDAEMFVIERRWTIPDDYIDPDTGEVRFWTPGLYERRHAVSAVGRSTESSIMAIPFEIRSNCGSAGE